MKTTHLAAGVLACTLAGAVQAQVVARDDRFSDIVRIGLPVAAAALSVYRDDMEGVKELGLSLVLSQATTAVLKRGIDSKRPDGRGHGFPSGHVSMAFTAAAYVHERYSLRQALPFYALATASAYQRVRTHNHFTRDVIGGAAVGMASALLLTHPAGSHSRASLGYAAGTWVAAYQTEW